MGYAVSSRALLVLVGLAAASASSVRSAADPPASQPAADNSAAIVLANKTIHFTPPEGWEASSAAATDVSAAFVWPDHGSILAVEVLPADAHISAAAAGAIIRSLNKTRQQRQEQLLLGPVVEKDPRFVLRIRERFKTAGELTAVQLHLYRQVGPRVVMVTLKTTADSGSDMKVAEEAGEQTSLSATFAQSAPAGRK